LRDLALFKFYRDIDAPDPTWILAYADSYDASLMLNALALTAGVNLYEANPPEMEGCVDPDLRHRIFVWVEKRKELFFSVNLKEVPEVGLFYSTASEFYGDPSWNDDIQHTDSYFGLSILLTRLGIPFKTVTDANLDGLKLVLVPHLTFKSEKEKKVLRKIAAKCPMIRDEANLGWKFWNAAKIGPNWGKSVSTPPDTAKCRKLQKKFRELIKVASVLEFDSANCLVPRIFYDGKRDRYVLRVLNLKGLSPKCIKPVPNEIHLKLNIPKEYSQVREHRFLKDEVKRFSLDSKMTIKSDVDLLNIYEISKVDE
jgi:hypothetical protein